MDTLDFSPVVERVECLIQQPLDALNSSNDITEFHKQKHAGLRSYYDTLKFIVCLWMD